MDHAEEHHVAFFALKGPSIAARNVKAFQDLRSEFGVQPLPDFQRLLVAEQRNHPNGTTGHPRVSDELADFLDNELRLRPINFAVAIAIFDQHINERRVHALGGAWNTQRPQLMVIKLPL